VFIRYTRSNREITDHADGKPPDLLVVLSVAFAAFMVNVDNYIVVIALPTITASFAIDTGAASWISISY
jgi:predicted MFS family arabinose efflux permease